MFSLYDGHVIHDIYQAGPPFTTEYGISYALDTGIAVVGTAYPADLFSGVFCGDHSAPVYSFDVATGEQLVEFFPVDVEEDDLFGAAVAIQGEFVIVGSARDNDNGFASGSVYVFDSKTGLQVHKLLSTDGAPSDGFGYDVDIDDGLIVVGAKNAKNTMGDRVGAVYIFDAITGEQINKIQPDDGAPQGDFGFSVSLHGGVLGVGAPNDEVGTEAEGSVYLYEMNNMSLMYKLIPPSEDGADWFGSDVDIDAGVVAIGAPFADHPTDTDFTGRPCNAGAVYIYDIDTGDQIAKLLPSDLECGDYIGESVAVADGIVAAGASGEDSSGTDAGAIYLFPAHLPGPCQLADVNQDGVLSPDDFSAWVAAFNTTSPRCDQNADGRCTPADFSAWVGNYNAGCN